ncbi:hypothetical protein [Puia dinghuensis]|uniref:Uncharacterized protein n=1 Tax=Puia dinghuensis TaxID=1792502 RepID=A0A8J2UB96_9BACT|nr:hypothetical protein [Puia dinghuensis]GGA91406.1 hypothetical protein GCM10011511_13440 [Puia dinghuensis]
MENKVSSRPFLPILIVFIVSTLFIVLARPLLAEGRFDFRVLLAGNILLFGVTVISFYLYTSALRNNNVHAFVRTMYGSLLVKLFACLLATLVYGWIAGRGVNKNGIFGCFGLYMLYTWLEVRILVQLNRKPAKNV